MFWNAPAIRALVRTALQEDSASSDITTQLLIDPHWRVRAEIVAHEKGVVAGLPLAGMFFRAFDPRVQFHAHVRDGARVRPQQVLATIRGRARSVLSAERPALNALQYLSGIATYTHAQVQKLKGTKAKLYDTRKTLPGWRVLQKYAVRCGGGRNQRMSLGDAAMIKENHLKIVRMAKSDWMSRLRRKMSRRTTPLVQMEIQTERDLKDALKLKPPRVLLDNLSPLSLKRMMKIQIGRASCRERV